MSDYTLKCYIPHLFGNLKAPYQEISDFLERVADSRSQSVEFWNEDFLDG